VNRATTIDLRFNGGGIRSPGKVLAAADQEDLRIICGTWAGYQYLHSESLGMRSPPAAGGAQLPCENGRASRPDLHLTLPNAMHELGHPSPQRPLIAAAALARAAVSLCAIKGMFFFSEEGSLS